MDTLLERFKRDQGVLRRTRSVRASLRLIGNRWRAVKSETDRPQEGNQNSQIFSKEKELSVAYAALCLDGTYTTNTAVMTKRKPESLKMRKKSGDLDLVLKTQKSRKIERSKFSELFNRKPKSVSAKELLVPDKVPPKAAAILQIQSPGKNKGLKKVKTIKSDGDGRRLRRGSESDAYLEEQAAQRGCVNHAFVYTSPPKDRRLPLSPSTCLKLQYGALLEGCGGELPSLSACSPHPPRGDRRLRRHKNKEAAPGDDNIAQINIHHQALFAAVEHGYVDKARNILESTDVDVNSLDPDGLSALDLATLAGNRPLAKMLTELGAREGTHFKTAEALGAHLRRLCREAESRVQEIGGYLHDRTPQDATRSVAGGQRGQGGMGCAGSAGSERDRQAQHWERRLGTIRGLVTGWQDLRVPGAPPPPHLEACGAHCVTVTLAPHAPPPALPAAPIFTKYRIEWSSRSDFSVLCGSRDVAATAGGGRVLVPGLTRGRRYFFRAAAGNLKGWGSFVVSVPRSVVPSSWRDACRGTPRGSHPRPVTAGGTAAAALDALSSAAAEARDHPAPAAPHPRPARKKTATIRHLFTAATKFQKNLRRGVYLACVLYHEDKVLVTGEEFLPVVEVDETYPPCIYNDFHWLMKVSCSWDEVKSLRSDMEKHTSSSVHFRVKLLAAVAQMQSALCLQDLGQVWYKPVRDAGGTVVLSCVQRARGGKAGVLNSRWTSLHKLRRRPCSDDHAAADLLLASVSQQIHYHQVCQTQLARGLYVGYLKLQSSVEVVRVVAPARSPNVPPHARVRDNPHVSAEEWEYLKSQSGKIDDSQTLSTLSINSNDKPSECQEMFLEQIANASRRLLKEMDILADNALAHRIYDLEVIELNSDISFIMICPPAEQACSVPGQKEILLQKGDLLSLPIQAFEMIHLQTYHLNILNRYSRLSCVLELDVALAAHSQREAFSSTELHTAKERLAKLEDLQNSLNVVWKAERWLMDLIGFARDKDKAGSSSGILLKHIMEKMPSLNMADNTGDPDLKIDFLQIPTRDGKVTKTSPGRGSWPGPAGNGNANLHAEFSKSEQQLSLAPRQTSVSTLNLSSSQYLNTESNVARKGSTDSQYTQFSMASGNYVTTNTSQPDVKSSGDHAGAGDRLPPSRSEDTLVPQSENMGPRPRPRSINASMSTSSSPMLTVRSAYPGTVTGMRTGKSNESAHSLSSDSETQSCATVPGRLRPLAKRVVPSKSMTNVKTGDVERSDCGGSEGEEARERNVKRHPLLEAQEKEQNTKVAKTEERQELDERADRPSERRAREEQPGILQVFAAYETGLAAGTSLKLHVTARTTAREVIDLVVKQLNMAAVLKGRAGPVYPPERLPDFCLVAVIGARERCLRDDFRPLLLQNPWRKGRLYVRLRHDVLAALQHSAKRPAFI